MPAPSTSDRATKNTTQQDVDPHLDPLALTVTRLARQLRRHAGTGLTTSQISALNILGCEGPMRVGRFAEIEGISNPTATRLTGKLQQMRLVDRTRDDTDARSWKVRLTPMGERLMTEASGRAGQYLSAKFSSLPSKDQHALLEALPALVQLLETKA